ncbi:acyl-CoA dehydrogenase [Tamaricihabitans halophyticus]|uniref:Acyl-CoA dehydrogenase n=1 Tax=Tamaricihabitans halophyticus TaxID=1262583 RepID=A0A4R2QSE6_9PSEU|nr:acyl-CoA dehydrogenase family protein [Tamaricihabitans halophyticus]TCP51889.1 acyl-CoA dehydrogenase [Tamaricihabitans halophyticus]
MINLEVPKKFGALVNQARQAANEIFRPISRKYDNAEHSYPSELDMLAALIDGLNSSGEGGAGAAGDRSNGSAKAKKPTESTVDNGNRNGANLATVLGTIEMCWGDAALLLSMPRQGLGNAAIAAVADDEQQARFGHKWAAMAITEPEFGSDSAAVSTTAALDGDEYVLNGEKIFVTAGERAEAVVVWASLDRSKGRAAIKSFVVEKGTPGFEVVRLEHKLGIRASDTAVLRFTDCRVPKENLLGSPEVDVKRGFAGVMQTFDNTRPLVAAMAVGLARAALDDIERILAEAGVRVDYDKPAHAQHAAAASYLRMLADWEAARLLTMKAAWMADNRTPNSLEASMSKAKAGRSVTDITLQCVQLAGSLGYTEASLLEKWARDAKIMDIFEGTQQIQQLIVARRLLGKSSTELK